MAKPPETAIGFVAMIDCGDSIESARKFVDTIHAGMVKDGFTAREETADGVDHFDLSKKWHSFDAGIPGAR